MNIKENKKELKPSHETFLLISTCIYLSLLVEELNEPVGKGFRLFLRKIKKVCKLFLGYLLCKLIDLVNKHIICSEQIYSEQI